MSESPQPKSKRPDLRATLLQIDLTDDSYKALAEFGGQIFACLENSKITADPNAVGVLDDLLGAVYSLILARHLFFDDRTDKPIEIPVVQKRASQVKSGDIRIDGKWIAGWHFNSALFRIAAVYHRFLRVAVGNFARNVYVKDLLPNVQPLYQQWTKAAWSNDHVKRIHNEVNTLKHTAQGLNSSRTATFDDALKGIRELLDLIEAWRDNPPDGEAT